MRRLVFAIRGKCSRHRWHDGERGSASRVLTQLAAHILAAKISLLILMVMRGLGDAREQDSGDQRQCDALAWSSFREGSERQRHTRSKCDADRQRKSRSFKLIVP